MTRKTISRKTKGAVAAVAGGALLVASGGTFAYWLDTAQLDGSTITAGELGLTASMSDAEYSINDGANWTALPTGYLMTPGHQVQFEVEVTATVKGTELRAELNLGPGRSTEETIPGTTVLWERSTDGGNNWNTLGTSGAAIPLSDNVADDDTFLLRVTLEFPWDSPENAGNSFDRVTPYQWTLEDAQLVLTQTGPNAP